MYDFCQDSNTKAREAVDSVNMGMVCTDGNSRREKESVEDFIQRVECISNGCTALSALMSSEEISNDVESWGGYRNEFTDFDMQDQ